MDIVYWSYILSVHVFFSRPPNSWCCNGISGVDNCLEDFERQALESAAHQPRLWKRYMYIHVDGTHTVLVKTHAQEFTDHLNSIDYDIKCMTEEKVITHIVSSEEVNIGTRTERALLDTWSVINDDGSIIRRSIWTSIYNLIAITR